ncbi:MAG TPA: TIGR03087 family PEP-CTERM/XrtA system glycosyltransferase, partial [Parvularculaceae bacterium]|nr:TIGR03087 family PEP-CTERM/XrtA system glycosyltransferase [Parvularculaceae bacterium]
MTRQPEILFIAHRIPYPPDKGDKIRSWRILKRLTERFRVHLAAFVDDPADFAHEAFLKSLCESVHLVRLNKMAAKARAGAALLTGEPLSLAYYRDPRMVRHIDETRRRGLAAEIAFSSSVAPYLEPAIEGRPRLVDLCDADSEKWRAYALKERGLSRWVYEREARRLSAAEAQILNSADAAFAASAVEAATLNARPGVSRAALVLANGVDTDYFAPDATFPLRPRADAVFIGAMDYKANVDAVLWFAREVWPLVRAKAPEATFAVIGPNPAPSIQALGGRSGIAVEGKVEDVRPYLKGARVVVAPLRIARGVQNKVLEAMAMARPIVATSAANAGVGAVADKEILIADEAKCFAQGVLRLIDGREFGEALGETFRL